MQTHTHTIMNSRALLTPAALLVLWLTTAGFAAQGYKIMHIGNSLTDQTYGVADAAVSQGYTGVQWGRYVCLGSSIVGIWEKMNESPGCFYDALRPVTDQYGASPQVPLARYLSSTSIDVVVLQIFSANGDCYYNRYTQNPFAAPWPNWTIRALIEMADKAYQGNPNCQVYLYASHTTRDTTDKNGAINNPYTNYLGLVDTLRKVYPTRKPVYIIPTPLALNMMVRDGFGDLWSDEIHMNNNGRYLIAMLFYSVIYKTDCANVTHSPAAVSGALPAAVSDAYARKAKQVAWDIARTYPYSGVTAATAARPSPVRTQVQTRACLQPGSAFTLTGKRSGTGPVAAHGLRVISVKGTPHIATGDIEWRIER